MLPNGVSRRKSLNASPAAGRPSSGCGQLALMSKWPTMGSLRRIGRRSPTCGAKLADARSTEVDACINLAKCISSTSAAPDTSLGDAGRAHKYSKLREALLRAAARLAEAERTGGQSGSGGGDKADGISGSDASVSCDGTDGLPAPLERRKKLSARPDDDFAQDTAASARESTNTAATLLQSARSRPGKLSREMSGAGGVPSNRSSGTPSARGQPLSWKAERLSEMAGRGVLAETAEQGSIAISQRWGPSEAGMARRSAPMSAAAHTIPELELTS